MVSLWSCEVKLWHHNQEINFSFYGRVFPCLHLQCTPKALHQRKYMFVTELYINDLHTYRSLKYCTGSCMQTLPFQELPGSQEMEAKYQVLHLAYFNYVICQAKISFEKSCLEAISKTNCTWQSLTILFPPPGYCFQSIFHSDTQIYLFIF